MLRGGSVAQSVEQRPFKALVPGSSPGRPKPSKKRFTNEKKVIAERATSRIKTHKTTVLFVKYSASDLAVPSSAGGVLSCFGRIARTKIQQRDDEFV